MKDLLLFFFIINFKRNTIIFFSQINLLLFNIKGTDSNVSDAVRIKKILIRKVSCTFFSKE